MAYSTETKEKAIRLRKRGFSIKEISRRFDIAQSTASLWLSRVVLSQIALKRLSSRVKKYQLISADKRMQKSAEQRKEYFDRGLEILEKIVSDKENLRVFCALLYFCEGAKSGKYFQFTNSDPSLIKTFLYLLRNSFDLNEIKFRVSLHLHKYHSNEKQIMFWSKITRIPPSQFIKPYKKSNTGKRKKDNYQGCVNIKYYDASLAKEILGIGYAFMKIYGGVV